MISLGLLMFALFVNLTIRDGGDRVRVTAICLIPLGLFELVAYSMGDMGEVYFWLAGLVSMAVVVTLQMFDRSPLSSSIQAINFGATLIHLYGLYCFHEGLGYTFYTPLIFSALILECLRLLIRTKKDGVFWSNHWLQHNADNHSGVCQRGDS